MKTRLNTIWKMALGLILLGAGLVTEVAAQSGKIYGTVTDGDGEVAPYANIILLQDGMPVMGKGTTSDLNGKYEISGLEIGTYTLRINYSGTTFEDPNPIKVSNTYVPMNLVAGDHMIDGGDPIKGEVVRFEVDPIDPISIGHNELVDMGIRDYRNAVAVMPGVYQRDAGDPVTIGGARSGGTVTMIDGNRMIGTPSLPQAAIQEVTLLSGGVPSEYGDVSGGVITITTRNPGMKGYFGPARSLVNIKDKKHKAHDKGQPESLLQNDFPSDSYAFNN